MRIREARRFPNRVFFWLMFCALLGTGRCLPSLAQNSGFAAESAPELRTHVSYSPLLYANAGKSHASLLNTHAESNALLLHTRVPENHSPRGALWRAAAFPGWGQVYNSQYYKLPFVYGAMGGLIYLAITNHHDYILYREAYQYKAFQELMDSGARDDNPRASFKDSYDQVAAEFGPVSSSPLRVQRNNFRRSRDLSLIGSGLVYGLAMLDAYVSAHLLDFDVGDDLGIAVVPVPAGIRISARVRTSK